MTETRNFTQVEFLKVMYAILKFLAINDTSDREEFVIGIPKTVLDEIPENWAEEMKVEEDLQKVYIKIHKTKTGSIIKPSGILIPD